jgi:arginine:ornithine antiporter/lysine permease
VRRSFTLALKMTSSMTLIPYLLVAAYGLKLAWTGENLRSRPKRPCQRLDSQHDCHDLRGRHDLCRRREVSAAVSASLYGPATALFIIARREQKKTAFTLVEGLLFGAILIAAAVGLYSLTAGTISM